MTDQPQEAQPLTVRERLESELAIVRQQKQHLIEALNQAIGGEKGLLVALSILDNQAAAEAAAGETERPAKKLNGRRADGLDPAIVPTA